MNAKIILPFIIFLSISMPVDAEKLLKNGAIYTLKPYPYIDSVYIEIEAQSEHPFLESIYAITYHGICIQHENAFNKEKRYLEPSFIAKEALISSIDSTRKPDITNKHLCTEIAEVIENKENTSLLFQSILNTIVSGQNEVEIDPLGKSLSAYEESGNYKLVWE